MTIIGQAVSWMMLGKLLLRRLLPSRHKKDGGEIIFFSKDVCIYYWIPFSE